MIQYILTILTSLLLLTQEDRQDHILHSILTGFSDEQPIIVEKWNVESGNHIIRETIDDQNRVIKLEFLRDGELSGAGFFPIAIITYSYTDFTITETAYDETGQNIYVDRHASHYQTIYHLDKEGYIRKADRISDFDTVDPIWEELDMEPTPLADLKEESRQYFEHFYAGKPIDVEYYRYSYHKLNGRYPVSRDYVPKYQGDSIKVWDPIEQEIKKAIERSFKR